MLRTVQSAFNLTNEKNKKNMELADEMRETGEENEDILDIIPPLDVLKYNKIPDLSKLPKVGSMYQAYKRMKHIVNRTPCQLSKRLSERYKAKIYLKREDLQVVRSYKLRGAFNKITSISMEDRKRGVVCASAGNHAQGVAYVCEQLKIQAKIFMPITTPTQKFNAVKSWGKQYSEIMMGGDTFDDSLKSAMEYCKKNNNIFVHAFDDDKTIEGQASIAIEILEDIDEEKIDFMFFPVGGGGCGAGMSSYFKQVSPQTILVGCEPEGSPSMKIAIETGIVQELKSINTFVDGAAIKKAGQRNFEILSNCLKDICLVPEGHVCTVMMRIFNEEGILVEPAGALAIGGLEQYKEEIQGRTVVCLISGSNNDISRMSDIRMLSEIDRGLQYYLLVNFFQKPGALKQFLSECLGPNDEVTNIEYTRKNNRERGPALVGLKVLKSGDMDQIKQNMDRIKITYKFLTPDQEIFKLLL